MDLLREDHRGQRDPEGLGGARSVDRNVLGTITDVERQVEEVVRRARDSAVPGGHTDDGTERLGLGPEPQTEGSVGHG
jgi:hypothetical protein